MRHTLYLGGIRSPCSKLLIERALIHLSMKLDVATEAIHSIIRPFEGNVFFQTQGAGAGAGPKV